MILNFTCKQTAKIWVQQFSKKLSREIQQVALRKLFMIERAITLDDLRIPPANRLEALTGSRKGQHSIRVNDQWPYVLFDLMPAQIRRIVDYH